MSTIHFFRVSIAQFGTFTNFTWVMKVIGHVGQRQLFQKISGLVHSLNYIPNALPVDVYPNSTADIPCAASLLFEEYVSSHESGPAATTISRGDDPKHDWPIRVVYY